MAGREDSKPLEFFLFAVAIAASAAVLAAVDHGGIVSENDSTKAVSLAAVRLPYPNVLTIKAQTFRQATGLGGLQTNRARSTKPYTTLRERTRQDN